MPRHIAQISGLIALLIAGGPEVKAQSGTSFKAAVGIVGSESFAMGVELWALTEIMLRPEHDISVETVEAASESERLRFLREGRTQFAVVNSQVPTSLAVDLRSVIAHPPKGIRGLDVKPLQLIARADMPEDAVYWITKVIFDHATKRDGDNTAKGMAALRDAINGLSLPVHPGAFRFYEDRANSYGNRVTPPPREAEAARDTAAFDEVGLSVDEALQLNEACRAAAARGDAEYFAGSGFDAPCNFGLPVFTLTGLSSEQDGSTLIAYDQDESNRPIKASRSGVMTMTSGLQPTM